MHIYIYVYIYVCIYIYIYTHTYTYIHNVIKYYTLLYHLKLYNVYISIYVLSKTKVKLGGLEVPFKKNSFRKKNNY